MKKSIEKMGKKDVQKLFYKTNPIGGISLIVLVITIIVVIILAAAVIISLQNNNPMVEANEARIKSDVANMQSIFTNTVGKIMAESQDVVVISERRLNTVTSGDKKAVGVAKYKIKGADSGVAVEGEIRFDTGTKSGTIYYTGRQLPLYNKETKWYVDSQGLISVNIGGIKYGEGEQVIEYEEVAVGEKVTESVKQYTDADGDKAIIPINFAIVPGKADISNGLVISDVANDIEDTGNQFVWIPVEDFSAFKREVGYCNGEIQTSANGIIEFEKCEEPYSSASDSERQEYDNMIASIKEYKGFYIGRYEISQSEDGTLKTESKKGKNPLANIKWGNSMTDLTGGIVEVARNMYPYQENAKKGEVVSTLIYGSSWDQTIRFLKTNENYKNIDKDRIDLGNLSTDKVALTGSKTDYALNNIYDIVGNVFEWTMESYIGESNNASLGRIFRGNGYAHSGNNPISYRGINTNTTHARVYIGGRVQLYIK